MPDAVVRIYKSFAFDVNVDDAKDPSDAIKQAEATLDEVSLAEALDKFNGEEVLDKYSDAEVTHFDGQDMFEDEYDTSINQHLS